MTFTTEEKAEIKEVLLFLIERKSEESGGHGGFHLLELNPILNEMVEEGVILERDTIHCNKYFLTDK
ncbi:MAG TPA: hypothetical protein VFM70_04420 [Salinimicrobium sp.]|nr:hypothetical protein [Salinimicrobium sp.]